MKCRSNNYFYLVTAIISAILPPWICGILATYYAHKALKLDEEDDEKYRFNDLSITMITRAIISAIILFWLSFVIIASAVLLEDQVTLRSDELTQMRPLKTPTFRPQSKDTQTDTIQLTYGEEIVQSTDSWNLKNCQIAFSQLTSLQNYTIPANNPPRLVINNIHHPCLSEAAKSTCDRQPPQCSSIWNLQQWRNKYFRLCTKLGVTLPPVFPFTRVRVMRSLCEEKITAN